MRRNLFLLIVVLAATSTLTLAAPKGVAQSPESPQNNAVGVVLATVSATSDHSSASDEVTIGAGRHRDSEYCPASHPATHSTTSAANPATTSANT